MVNASVDFENPIEPHRIQESSKYINKEFTDENDESDGEYVEESEEATDDDDPFDDESASESGESEASSDEIEIIDEGNIDNLFS